MKRRSEFKVNPEEELDLQHQGSLGGQEIVGKYGRAVESNISSLDQSGKADLTAGKKAAKGPDVAMSSPSQKRPEQETPQSRSSKGPEQEKSPTKHHYK